MKKLQILTLFLLSFLSAMSQDTLGVKRISSFYDFSITLGKSGWSIPGYTPSSPIVALKFKDYGLSFRLGSKWSLKEIGNNYNIGVQCNWIRLKATYGYGTREYQNSGYDPDTLGYFSFDAPILNVGLVNQIKFGQSTLQLNFNTGPTIFYYTAIAGGWVVNPEIKFVYRKLYLGLDYSLISILYDRGDHISLYRSYTCFSIGKNF